MNRASHLLLSILILPCVAYAENDASEGWWVGLDLGAADLSYDLPQASDDKTAFFLALRAGYQFSNRLRLGFETNGFNIESGNYEYSGEGEGISQLALITIEYYPMTKRQWYVKAGTGWNSYWDNDSDVDTHKTDSGAWLLGLGYNYSVKRSLDLLPFLQLQGGEVADGDYDAVTVGVSLVWRSF